MMRDDEYVCRVVLFPRYYRNGVYAPDVLVKLDKVPDQKGAYALSVGSRSMLQTLEQAHRYGQRVAEIANEQRSERLGRVLQRGELQLYVAFYDLLVEHIMAEQTDMHRIEVLHLPEHGQSEHCEIRVIERDEVKHLPRDDRSDDRVAISRMLLERLWGVCAFLDEIDIEDGAVEIDFLPGPCGPCRGDVAADI